MNEDLGWSASSRDENNYYRAMVTLDYNLFNGGADKSLKQKRISQIGQESEMLSDYQRSVKKNINLAWEEYATIKDQLEFLRQHVEYSKMTLDSYREEFTLGRRDLLDILDTEGEYYSARQELVKAELDLIQAKFKILQASGDLSKAFNISVLDKFSLRKDSKVLDDLPLEM